MNDKNQLDDFPFSPSRLRAAGQACHHEGWNITQEQKEAMQEEFRFYLEHVRDELHIDMTKQDSARNRAVWTLMGAVYTQGIEVGYRMCAEGEFAKTMRALGKEPEGGWTE